MPTKRAAAAPTPRARVVLHALPGTKKAHEVCRLVERLLGQRHRLAVWFSDAGRAEVLNQYLWTFSQSSFVPHGMWREGDPVEDPVVLVVGSVGSLPEEYETLVVADRAEDLTPFARFVEIHDLVARSAEDQGKREAWQAAGFAVQDAGGTSSREE